MAGAGSFNNTVATVGVDRRSEEMALAVISQWVREVRPKWCCMCHQPCAARSFRTKDRMCHDCFWDLQDDDFTGRFPRAGPNCQCFRCEEHRTRVEANRGKRKWDKIACVWYTVGDATR